jgi:hypothetical protein
MGHPLYPVFSDVFIEGFEYMILSQETHKLLCLFCYINDTLVIWRHGIEKLVFVDHLNGLHINKFTLEAEKDDHFSLLHIDVSGDQLTPWAANFSGNLPAQNFARTMDRIIIPTNKPFLQPAHTEQGFCATRKASTVSRSPLRRLYWKTVTVLS